MQTIYNQKLVKLIIDGFKISGLFEGASVTVRFDGGEVEKTQGTDGPGMNVATMQGGALIFQLQELSNGHDFLWALSEKQQLGFPGVTAIATLGTGAIVTYINTLVSLPAEFATGDKKQAGINYTLISQIAKWSNLRRLF